ncbi:EscV/YscV/HrcV family type III secretion system export apparatus protein [Chlamydia muridarum str. Nigg]|jgi:type III secretion protein, HrcV family|uniref:Low calcium response locus protein D n=2 Tax=Chlamydia muridarum TaxID=83560 RepID=A0A097KEN3_CHLMR|nr:SctV family type III secretion system export apparatus subunit CdsV [Chlamydia muridarum]AAF39226.1 type III secretion inner membrane protein SctV [Chlamydia muridarum str. Nigg]AHH22752.1 Low calcium response locus protein D [Chlamydia muridarum str. Nigg3 CMUT3-5]AHH23677.1 Low calcium response locus protein D [Chlamydia muridarum str. Nigg CM972]AID37892.1 Low calcium response locus protein D [Chlamydia muridarum str. Nigg 2 MCR]AIT90559.1 Low calcium response locus protein D [Chlamydia 
MNKLLNFVSRTFGGDAALNMINKSSDLILAMWMLGVVLMIIMPLPPVMVDFMITINLAISVFLLMVALYIPSALQLSVFPSLLLITTMFRLGINISSSRQILLHAYAGNVIQAFGDFVVGGNYVVGFIIFLIITIIQFIVVTKGAERVAEVAARFRLDAMPGKQMAIDADLRAGMIDATQARDKRAQIQKESELYGAMDGAMKFIKGDVIAGIVISLINIVGGLVIGVTMKGMTMAQAAHIYTLITIGDGLVSQIPSLLISLTAGIVTTRVSSDKDTNLGKEISSQLVKEPRALLLSAVATLGIGFFKGFPLWSFALMAVVFAVLGILLITKKNSPGKKGSSSSSTTVGAADGASASGENSDDYALTLPVILELGKDLSKLIQQRTKSGQSFVDDMIPKMRQALYQDIGIRYPGIHVRTDSPSLEGNDYMILLNEVPYVRGKIPPNHVLTNEVEENLSRYNLPFITYKNAAGLPSTWVSTDALTILEKAAIKYWSPLEVIILHLSYFFHRNSQEFLGIQEVRSMIEFMERSFPDLVKEVTRLIPLQKLTEIFKRLVQEQISIKDLRTILESLSEWAQTEKDTVLLTEYVRSSLKLYISFKFSQGQSAISVYLLDPEIEEMIRGAIKQTSAGSYLALDPDSVNLILKSMRMTITPTPPGGQPPVLLTAIDVRRYVRKLIETEFPDIAVISYQEVLPEIRIQPLGRIQIF